jgi:hypothetical protein
MRIDALWQSGSPIRTVEFYDLIAARARGLIRQGISQGRDRIAAGPGALSGDEQRPVEDENRGGPQTKRAEVARGKAAKLGEVRLLRSRGPEGECLGIQLVNPPGAVTLAGAEDIVYEGCGPRGDDFEISTLNDTDFTLVYGMVPEPTETVDVTSRGEATRNVRALEGESGRDYVVTTLPGGAGAWKSSRATRGDVRSSGER